MHVRFDCLHFDQLILISQHDIGWKQTYCKKINHMNSSSCSAGCPQTGHRLSLSLVELGWNAHSSPKNPCGHDLYSNMNGTPRVLQLQINKFRPLTYLVVGQSCMNLQVYRWQGTSWFQQIYEQQLVFRNEFFGFGNYSIIKQTLVFKPLLGHRWC